MSELLLHDGVSVLRHPSCLELPPITEGLAEIFKAPGLQIRQPAVDPNAPRGNMPVAQIPLVRYTDVRARNFPRDTPLLDAINDAFANDSSLTEPLEVPFEPPIPRVGKRPGTTFITLIPDEPSLRALQAQRQGIIRSFEDTAHVDHVDWPDHRLGMHIAIGEWVDPRITDRLAALLREVLPRTITLLPSTVSPDPRIDRSAQPEAAQGFDVRRFVTPDSYQPLHQRLQNAFGDDNRVNIYSPATGLTTPDPNGTANLTLWTQRETGSLAWQRGFPLETILNSIDSGDPAAQQELPSGFCRPYIKQTRGGTLVLLTPGYETGRSLNAQREAVFRSVLTTLRRQQAKKPKGMPLGLVVARTEDQDVSRAESVASVIGSTPLHRLILSQTVYSPDPRHVGE